MEKFREFQGKDLDECIKAACAFFDAPREKLEIEIMQDAKSGIFGIVLARKAKIRARRARLDDTMRDILGPRANESAGDQAQPAREEKNQEASSREVPARESAPRKDTGKKNGPPREHRRHDHAPRRSERQDNPESRKKHVPDTPPAKNPPVANPGAEENLAASQNMDIFDGEDDGLPLRPMEELDLDRLVALTGEVVSTLLKPIAGHEVSVTVAPEHGSIHARVDWKGDAGLLIGREGQTLAALQYLSSRILSHAFNAALRVQLDIGDYRRRQDDKLRDLGLSLAEKARKTGRSWSTRPLSSYHRRIIHMTLQDAPDVQTRSSGDGPLKRVVISPRRHTDKE